MQVMRVSLLVLLLAACCCAQRESVLSWRRASDPAALCNDYTTAGFFLNLKLNSSKWIIFLESGSLCYSNDTCNRRFFRESIREEENVGGTINAEFPYGNFNTSQAYANVRANDLSHSDYANPLMTSMECVLRGNLTVVGKDIMDSDKTINPDFYGHNHVIIPYCSSDLWLGEETAGPDNCACTELDCFGYQADSPTLQFTFRGKIIFQTIFKQLQTEYGMDVATEVIISGSSAGGVGAINHAKWVRDQLMPGVKLLILLDSSWFINFQESIHQIFLGMITSQQSSSQQNDAQRVLSIFKSNPACEDLHFGYPCCISAHCVMTRRNESTGNLAYYPETNQRTFAIFSLYDLFLLAPAIMGQVDFISDDGNGVNASLTSMLINLLRTIGEYGGEMNSTASMAFHGTSFLSFYSPQCLQHVYLATSNLWEGILSSITVISDGLSSFSHNISSGRWSSLRLAVNSTSDRVTIQEAISEWYQSTENRQYMDDCYGPYCNKKCPDEVLLLEITSDNWPNWIEWLVILVTILISIVCMAMKTLFTVWLFIMDRKQLAYLNSLRDPEDANAPSKLQLTECEEKDMISVSCLDLTYSVTFKITKPVKDESKDENNIVALHDIPEEDLVEDNEDVSKRTTGIQRIRKTLRLPDRTSHEHKTSSTDLSGETKKEKGAPVPQQTNTMEDATTIRCFQEYTTKHILRGISLYFNPGSIIGIMGPSGCGKTTFLDILTGRRRKGKFSGSIYVNGFALDNVRDWYIGNTGYVLQLAAPYYPELTVRDNLTLSAQIMLSKEVTMRDKFQRVELVMNITGLNKLANTVVGGDIGPGLSGGQKRRLAVAIQLLNLPSIIYLDEPTSGLDATSSMELLYHLNLLAKSGRTVLLTIHQPRMEIFHMFDRLVLLSDGKVAYHGGPEKAYEVFVSALLKKRLDFSSLKEQNPADVIMDILGQPKLRKAILEYYEGSPEPTNVRKAVSCGISREHLSRGLLQVAPLGNKKLANSSSFTRIAALEARASKKLSFGDVIFMPIFFFLLAFVMGTVYYQRTDLSQIVPAICVFSCASGIFVFPALEPYYTPAIRLYSYEKTNGIGKSRDLVIQGFMRYATIAFIPVLVSTSFLYFVLIKITAYSLLVYIQMLVVNVSLNLTWIALLIFLLMAFRNIAFRISSLVSALAGFGSGFFIPIGDIHWIYRWIAYINPNYYALSSVVFFILKDFNICEGSQFECFFESGPFILRRFYFDGINPYLHLVVLLIFTIFYLCMAIFANWLHFAHLKSYLKYFFMRFAMLKSCFASKERTAVQSGKQSRWTAVRKALKRGSFKRMAHEDEAKRDRTFSFLSGEETHKVWRPKVRFMDIVAAQMQVKKEEVRTIPPLREIRETSLSIKDLQAENHRRKKTLMNRVNFAWKVLQENPVAASEDHKGKERWKAAAKKVSSEKKQADFYQLVASLVSK